jgi:hypothetical protein
LSIKGKVDSRIRFVPTIHGALRCQLFSYQLICQLTAVNSSEIRPGLVNLSINLCTPINSIVNTCHTVSAYQISSQLIVPINSKWSLGESHFGRRFVTCEVDIHICLIGFVLSRVVVWLCCFSRCLALLFPLCHPLCASTLCIHSVIPALYPAFCTQRCARRRNSII